MELAVAVRHFEEVLALVVSEAERVRTGRIVEFDIILALGKAVHEIVEIFRGRLFRIHDAAYVAVNEVILNAESRIVIGETHVVYGLFRVVVPERKAGRSLERYDGIGKVAERSSDIRRERLRSVVTDGVAHGVAYAVTTRSVDSRLGIVEQSGKRAVIVVLNERVNVAADVRSGDASVFRYGIFAVTLVIPISEQSIRLAAVIVGVGGSDRRRIFGFVNVRYGYDRFTIGIGEHEGNSEILIVIEVVYKFGYREGYLAIENRLAVRFALGVLLHGVASPGGGNDARVEILDNGSGGVRRRHSVLVRSGGVTAAVADLIYSRVRAAFGGIEAHEIAVVETYDYRFRDVRRHLTVAGFYRFAVPAIRSYFRVAGGIVRIAVLVIGIRKIVEAVVLAVLYRIARYGVYDCRADVRSFRLTGVNVRYADGRSHALVVVIAYRRRGKGHLRAYGDGTRKSGNVDRGIARIRELLAHLHRVLHGLRVLAARKLRIVGHEISSESKVGKRRAVSPCARTRLFFV